MLIQLISNFSTVKFFTMSIKVHYDDGEYKFLPTFKNNKGKEYTGVEFTPSKLRRKIKSAFMCGACGNVGHIRTNKRCPLYNSSLMKKPKKQMGSKKRRRSVSEWHCDYLKKNTRTVNRRRTDPVVVLSTILENILNEMRNMPNVQLFLFPVNPKLVLDYHKIIQRPMDLQTIRNNLRQNKYQNRDKFLADVNQIVENSVLYNGAESSLTVTAQRMLEKCLERLAEKKDSLMSLEKAINPLLGDNDQISLTFILDKVINTKLKVVQESWPFLKPVNKQLVKDYYSIIKRPMDLETITKKVAAHKYHSRYEFLVDIEQILQNCILYNGKDSQFSAKAEQLVKICKVALDEYDEQLTQLENKIAFVQEIPISNDDKTSMGGNDEKYNTAEPDQVSQASSLDHMTIKSQIDDYDQVDVENVGLQGMEPRSQKNIIEAYDFNMLKEYLQFYNEEEVKEVSLSEFEDDKKGFLISEKLPMEGNADDNNQPTAKAMLQLGSWGYYQQNDGDEALTFKEESKDVDPNYDPSYSLMSMGNHADQITLVTDPSL